MSKFTKLTIVAVFALLIIGSLFTAEARDLNRRQEETGKGKGKETPSGDATTSSPTGTGTGEPSAPTDVPAATDTPTAPTDVPGVPNAAPTVPTGGASDIASLLNSAAKTGVSASPSPSGSWPSGYSASTTPSAGTGPASTPSSANKIESGIFGVAIAALVSLFL